MSKKFIVIDVEGLAGQKPYDVGYIVADKYEKIYRSRSFCLFPNLLQNSQAVNRNSDENCKIMTARNFRAMTQDFENPPEVRKWQVINNTDFKRFFESDVKEFKVKKAYGFNIKFDRKMIENIFGVEFEDISLDWRDIQTAILQTRLMTRKYLDFCYNNNFRTPKGFPQTKAETVFRYITNDIEFVEEHTGLSDVLIEYKILLSAFKTKKKIDFSAKTPAWKVLNEFAKSIEHPIAVKKQEKGEISPFSPCRPGRRQIRQKDRGKFVQNYILTFL